MFLPNRCQVCKVMDFWNTSFQNGGRWDVLTAFRGFSSRSRKRGELPGIAVSWKGVSRRRRGNSSPQGGRKQRIRCPKHCQQGLTAVSLSNWKMVKELWWFEIPRLFYVVFIQMSDIHDFPAYLGRSHSHIWSKCWSPDWGHRRDGPTRPTSPKCPALHGWFVSRRSHPWSLLRWPPDSNLFARNFSCFESKNTSKHDQTW